MTNVLLSTRKAASATMDTVTTTVTSIAAAALSLGNLATAAEAHSAAYLENTRKAIARDSITHNLVAEQEAAITVSRRLNEIDKELKDPALKRTYDEVLSMIRAGTTAEMAKPTLVAAE